MYRLVIMEVQLILWRLNGYVKKNKQVIWVA